MHQSTTPSLPQTIWPRWPSRQFLSLPLVQTLLPVTFAYSLSSEAVVMRQLRRWKRLWQKSLTCPHKRTSMGPSRSCWNGTTSALQPEEITLKGTSFMCILSIKVPIRKKSGNLFNDPRTSYKVVEKQFFKTNTIPSLFERRNCIYLKFIIGDSTDGNTPQIIMQHFDFSKSQKSQWINYIVSSHFYFIIVMFGHSYMVSSH